MIQRSSKSSCCNYCSSSTSGGSATQQRRSLLQQQQRRSVVTTTTKAMWLLLLLLRSSSTSTTRKRNPWTTTTTTTMVSSYRLSSLLNRARHYHMPRERRRPYSSSFGTAATTTTTTTTTLHHHHQPSSYKRLQPSLSRRMAFVDPYPSKGRMASVATSTTRRQVRLPMTTTTSDTTTISTSSSTTQQDPFVHREDVTTTTTTNDATIVQQDETNNNNKEWIEQLTQTWRDHPACNPRIQFKSWVINVGRVSSNGSNDDDLQHPPIINIQSIVRSPLIQPYLASRLDHILDHLHVRFKIVRDWDHDNNSTSPSSSTTTTTESSSTIQQQQQKQSKSQKLILLHPDTPPICDLPVAVQELLGATGEGGNDDDVVTDGPLVPIQFQYRQFTASFILQQVLPASVHPVPTAFETVGHVAHLNLRSAHVPYQTLIGQVLLETIPTIETVICKVGDVTGPYRTYNMQLLAGKNDTNVSLMENGISIQFDLAKVYWCSRLSQERQRLLHDEILSSSPPSSSSSISESRRLIVVADVFCGVGALCIQQAASSRPQVDVEVWANDWNPNAIDALQHNIERNGVKDCFRRITCGDAYDYLMDLGIMGSSSTSMATPPATTDPPPIITSTVATTTKSIRTDRTSKFSNRYRRRSTKSSSSARQSSIRLPDHVVMNYPLEAPTFLGALRWWPTNTEIEPRVHVYTFARATGSNDNKDNNSDDADLLAEPLSAADVAVNLIADHLLPPVRRNEDIVSRIDSSGQATRRQRILELNHDYDCRVNAHHVRDVAPGKLVFCVSFTATRKLLRHMRGDFS